MLKHHTLHRRGGAPGARARQQTGAATLTVTVLVLLVVSVLVFHSHQAAWLEQRAITNQTRAKQAHAAAEAGLEVALAVLNADSGSPRRATHLSASLTEAGKFNVNATPVALTGSPADGMSYSVTYSFVAPNTLPADRFQLISKGGSDCSNIADLNTCTARATVGHVVQLTPVLLNPPAAAITRNASFENLFGASQATIKAMTTAITSGASLDAATSGLAWHQGALILSGTVGSASSPVLLVVEGDLTIPAGVVVNGFVYVTGNVTCASCAAPSIQGAIAIAGTDDLDPDKVQYPADTANGPLARVRTTAVRFAKVIGTWRDW